MAHNIEEKAAAATRWSFMTEIGVKLITPIVNILLAHILLPSAFGVVASITLITSFAEMLQDAGFQKYLIQHDFSNELERNRYANVAFWTNFLVAFLFCSLIVLFRKQIAVMIGVPSNTTALALASLALPLTALCSIQTALFQRDLDFRSLFIVRVSAAFIPLAITLPLAIAGWSYWSLIVGTLSGKLFNAVVLSIRSSWTPSFCFEFKCLIKMWSFSAWTLLESISIWLTSWVGVFIIGGFMGEHYVGLYNNSIAVVNSVVAIVSASIASVLTSTLSKMQHDKEAFQNCFFKFQRGTSFIIFLIGALFSSFGQTATELLLGPNWSEAAILISLWGLSSAIVVPFANYGSIAYVALGKPKLSFTVQVAYLFVLVPAIYCSAQMGFVHLSITAALCRLVFVAIHLFVMRFALHLSVRKMIANVWAFLPPLFLLTAIVWLARILLGWNIAMDFLMGASFVLLYILLFRKEPFIKVFTARFTRNRNR